MKKDFAYVIKVSEMIKEGAWKWPFEWYAEYPILKHVQVPNLQASEQDSAKQFDQYWCVLKVPVTWILVNI